VNIVDNRNGRAYGMIGGGAVFGSYHGCVYNQRKKRCGYMVGQVLSGVQSHNRRMSKRSRFKRKGIKRDRMQGAGSPTDVGFGRVPHKWSVIGDHAKAYGGEK
jgi:hypothetical protein